MAGASKDEQLARRIYAALQAASCPLVEGLHLQDAGRMQQMLCTPSQHRTDILAWICSSINPNLPSLKPSSLGATDPDALSKDMAMLGDKLMLCRADDLDLITGHVSPRRQLQFLEQLLTLVPGCGESAEHRGDGEALLNELFTAKNVTHLTHMLNPTLNPWPGQIKALRTDDKSFHMPSREEGAEVEALLQSTQLVLEQLKSECEFLHSNGQSPGVFSSCALRVALCDLQQLMATFSHVYETDVKAYCNRDPPNLSTETHVFHRVEQLLLACNTELEVLNELSEASVSTADRVRQLQTQLRYWSHGEKHTLPSQLEELTRRYRNLLYRFKPSKADTC